MNATLFPGDPVGVAAALYAAAPGHSKLIEAPKEVWKWYRRQLRGRRDVIV